MNELIEVKNIKATPATIDGIDFDQAKVTIEHKMKPYTQMIVTEQNTPQIKQIIADIRREANEVNSVKVNLKKMLSKDIVDMENKFKDLLAVYDGVIKPLGEKVKTFEEEAYHKRKEDILKSVNGLLAGTPYTMEQLDISDRWFLKSARKKDIEEDVTEQIKTMTQNTEVIKRTIDEKNQLLSNDALNYALYERYINKPLALALGQIENDFTILMNKQNAAAKKAAEDAAKAAQAAQVVQATPPVTPTTPSQTQQTIASMYGTPNVAPTQVPVEQTPPTPVSNEPFVAPWDVVTEYVNIEINRNDLVRVQGLLTQANINYKIV